MNSTVRWRFLSIVGWAIGLLAAPTLVAETEAEILAAGEKLSADFRGRLIDLFRQRETLVKVVQDSRVAQHVRVRSMKEVDRLSKLIQEEERAYQVQKEALLAQMKSLTTPALPGIPVEAEGRKVKSRLHGMTLSVKLPPDWSDITVSDELSLRAQGGTAWEQMKDIVLYCYKSQENAFVLQRLPSLASDDRLTAQELEEKFMSTTVTAGEKYGSLTKAPLTLLGKPAHGILADYVTGVPAKRRLSVSIITLEPVDGRFYKLICHLTPENAAYGMSLPDFAACVTLLE